MKIWLGYAMPPAQRRRYAFAFILLAYTLSGIFALNPAALAAQTNRSPVAIELGAAMPSEPYLEIIESLGNSGFLIEQINRTWLNRIRIIAVNDQIRREIVISQSTGQILRDVAYAR